MKLAMAAALSLAVVAMPAQGQSFSDGFTFLKAVKDRDGAKAESMLAGSGSTVINSKDAGDGQSALHIVIRGRDRPWLGFLLSKGARPDLQDKSGNTALALASQLGWEEGAEVLLRVGASVDLPNNRGETPLMFAVRSRNPEIVRLLLSKGADPKRTDNVAGYSALDYAKQDPRAGGIVKLLEAPREKPREVAGPPR